MTKYAGKLTIFEQEWEVFTADAHDPELIANGVDCAGTTWCGHFKIFLSNELRGSRLKRTIRHEITHAFDLLGANFDENGNVDFWWTERDYSEFEKLCADVVKLYKLQIYETFYKNDYNHWLGCHHDFVCRQEFGFQVSYG